MIKLFKKHKIILSITISILVLLVVPNFLLYTMPYGDNFSNSFYSASAASSNRTVMVIAPHEDDELLVAGEMIRNFILQGSKVIVVFTTNGDTGNDGKKRINEALSSTKLLGIPEENVIFLGYGDAWNTDYKNIYYAEADTVIPSSIKRTETYGTDNHKDFRSTFSGKPNPYTRQNFKNDITDVILKYLPDYIFSVDFDSHPSHRATSLIFEEAMFDILKKGNNYTPIIYKGYSYNTALFAANDFYKLNMESTLLPDINKLNAPGYELDTPNYNWKERVRFPVPPDMLSYTMRSNLFFKAFSVYKSQHIKEELASIINSDKVYWERRTDSITYTANISVSSGNPLFLNDFKIIDSGNIFDKHATFGERLWMPSKDDKEKSVKISFASPQSISLISLYDNVSLTDNILSGTFKFSDGTQIAVGPLNKNGSHTDVEFPVKNNITYVEFKIDTFEGEKPGLKEIEVYKTKDIAQEPQFIKLMLSNNTSTFLYRYICGNEKEIPLSVYMYPNTQQDSKYTMKIINDSGGNATLKNNTLLFKKSLLPEKCKVRVELVDNPNVYDEVEFVRNNYEIILIKVLQKYEKKFNAIQKRIGDKETALISNWAKK